MYSVRLVLSRLYTKKILATSVIRMKNMLIITDHRYRESMRQWPLYILRGPLLPLIWKVPKSTLEIE